MAEPGPTRELDGKKMAQFQKSVVVLEELVARHPDVPAYQTLLASKRQTMGDICAKLGDRARAMAFYEKVIDTYKQLCREHPDDTEYISGLAGIYNQVGNGQVDRREGLKWYDRSIELMRKILADKPSDTETRSSLSNVLVNVASRLAILGDVRKAIVAWEEIIGIREKNVAEAPSVLENQRVLVASYNSLAKLQNQVGEADAASETRRKAAIREELYLESQVAQYRAALQAKPNDAVAHANLAGTLARQGKPEEAIAEYREALRLKPDSPGILNNFAGLLERQVKLEEGIAEFREAVRISPENVDYNNYLGCALGDQRKLDEAIACFRKAIELNPKYVAGYANLGEAYEKQGKLDEAIASYRKAIDIEPKHPYGYCNLASLLATAADPKWRQPTLALEHAKKAVELAPNFTDSWKALGIAAYRNGDWQEAINSLKKSEELFNGGMDYNRFFLAMAHWQLDQKEDANKWYGQAVEWMEKNKSKDEKLLRFREEATELLGIPDTSNQESQVNQISVHK